MPKPRKGESQKNYVGRAIPIIMQEHPDWPQKQAVAVAYSMFRQNKKKKRKKK